MLVKGGLIQNSMFIHFFFKLGGIFAFLLLFVCPKEIILSIDGCRMPGVTLIGCDMKSMKVPQRTFPLKLRPLISSFSLKISIATGDNQIHNKQELRPEKIKTVTSRNMPDQNLPCSLALETCSKVANFLKFPSIF